MYARACDVSAGGEGGATVAPPGGRDTSYDDDIVFAQCGIYDRHCFVFSDMPINFL